MMRAILTYHSIDTSGSVISIPPAVFAGHVRWLGQAGLRVLTLDDLLAQDSSDERDAVAITFDDGFASVGAAAAALEEAGFPVTLFVVSDHVGGTNAWNGRREPDIPELPLLDWATLETLVARGVAIGAHTRTHPHLPTLTQSAIEDEMDGCVDTLRRRLGVRATHFAYPYGAVSSPVAALAACRFTASLTTTFGQVKGREPRARVPRLDMYYFRRPGALAAWGTPRFSRRLRSIALRRRLRALLS